METTFFRIGASALLLMGAAGATSYYASPTGSAIGNGSFSAPWDLQTALNSTAVRPGDTVWLRGGIYQPPTSQGFSSRLAGSSSHPINVRNYQAEQPTIDRNGAAAGLAIYGSNTAFSGIRVMDSTTNVSSEYVVVYGSAIKCSGMMVNNTAIGFTSNASNHRVAISTAALGTGTALAGTISLTAIASGNAGVTGVQFQVDGVNLGSKVTQAPFTMTWNTTGTSNASHTIAAIASDPTVIKATASEVVAVNNWL